ncbi:MAG TPA: hypothetical protein VHW47_01985 [Acidimicrobiales bacterium]|jgi:hypothetical protein|nr:hypothetical protein [Acidimicrobiales bacterium]
MPPHRILAGAVLGGTAVLGLAGGSATAAGAATKPVAPKALLAASLAAAKSQPSVHFVAVSTISTQSITITADIGQAKGTEAIAISDGLQSGHVDARLVKKVAYFRGDTNGLEGYLGMPATLAAQYANRWIAFKSSDKYYKTVSQAMTMKNAVAQISVKAPISSAGSSTVSGTAATGVKGTTASLGTKGTAVLYVPAQGSVLPLRYTGQGIETKKKATGQVDFTKWGETFRVTAPAKSVPSSSV